MATRSLTLQIPRGAPIAAAGLLSSVVVGVALAAETPVGIALLLGLVYAPLAMLNLRLGVALWAPLVFLEGIPALNMGGKAGGLLLLGAWVGALRGGMVTLDVLRHNRRVFELLLLLNVWLTLSLLWSADVGRALDDIWHWWAVALVFILVASVADTGRAVRWIAIAFVVGGVLSVLVGIPTGDLTRATTAEASSRLGSATDDPNFMAAGLITAMVLAAALLVSVRVPAARLALVVGIGIMALGIVLSQSRGGMLAALATALASVAFFRRRRVHAVALVLVVMSAAGMAFLAVPGAWERVSNFDNGGSGRSDLWTVAWRTFEDHPIIGVGVNNFGAVAKDYVREGGALERVNNIAESPHYVHNVYLQLAAENGIIGLAIILALVIACLRAAYLAAKRFRDRGMVHMEVLSHAVLVATIGQLAAAFFISSTVDRRLWIMLALGPALLSIAVRGRDDHEPAT